MQFSAQQIAQLLHGRIEGNPDRTVNNFSKIEDSIPHTLTFLGNPKYVAYIYETKASIALVNDDFVAEQTLPDTLTLIRVPNAYAALAQLMQLAEQVMKPKKQGIEQPSYISNSAVVEKDSVYVGAFAYIGDNVRIGKNVSIYPNSYIGDNVVINDDTTIFAGVKVYRDCQIGSRCIIHAGAVIGADGFGFAKEGDIYNKIPQLGNVIIEDDVEIGANTTIDRAVMDSTIIRKGVKLDNLIQIAHNVEIGENTAMAAQAGIAGSTKVGKNCMIGGQVGIGGHLKIGNNVNFGAQAGCISNQTDGKTVMGSPVMDLSKFMRASVIYTKLPEIYQTINQLEREIKKLKSE